MDEMTVLLPHGLAVPLGISCNNRLIIRQLDAMSLADKVLRVGDRVLAVDDTQVNTLDDLARCIAHNHQCVIVLRVQLRGMHRAMPAHDDCGDQVRIALTWLRHGPKLGMAIKQHKSLIIVSRVTPQSVASYAVRANDVLLSINDQPPLDRDTAKRTIVDELSLHGYVMLTVQRANMNSLAMTASCSPAFAAETQPVIDDSYQETPRTGALKSILKKRTTSSSNVRNTSAQQSRSQYNTSSKQPLISNFVDGLRMMAVHRKHVHILSEPIEHVIPRVISDSNFDADDDGQNYTLITIDRSVS